MARKNDVTAKLDATALDKARMAAALRRQSVAEFLSEVVVLAAQKVIDDFAVQRSQEIVQAVDMRPVKAKRPK